MSLKRGTSHRRRQRVHYVVFGTLKSKRDVYDWWASYSCEGPMGDGLLDMTSWGPQTNGAEGRVGRVGSKVNQSLLFNDEEAEY